MRINPKSGLGIDSLNCIKEYNGDSLIFYNSSLKINGISLKKTEKGTSCTQSKKTVKFLLPKKLGKEKLLVNFCLEPVSLHLDPLQEIFVNSNVEYDIDNFYSLESIGIKEEQTPDIDALEVDKFKQSISFEDSY